MPKQAEPWFRESSGTWVIRQRGRLTTLAKGRANRAAAVKRWRELQASPPSGLTVGDLAERFLAWCDANKAETTARWYRRHLAAFAAFVGPGKPCEAVEAADYDRWASGKDWSRSTRHGAVTSIKRLYAWGGRYAKLATNPVIGLEPPGIDRRTRIPTTQEVNEVLDAARGPVRDYLEFLAETGCRQTEAHRLRVEHVDLASDCCAMLGKTSGKDRRPRVIYLTPAARKILERRMDGLRPEALVFGNRKGLPWTIQRSRNAVRNLQLRLGLGSHVSAGGLRHWWITERLRAGVPVAHVAELAGHRSTTMIARHYGHLGEHGEDLRRALNRQAG